MKKKFYYFALLLLCLHVSSFCAVSLTEEEQASLLWIQLHTKACPGCGVRIEKNGGCDYMLCTQCGYEFCWQCLQPHDHKNHVCKKGTY